MARGKSGGGGGSGRRSGGGSGGPKKAPASPKKAPASPKKAPASKRAPASKKAPASPKKAPTKRVVQKRPDGDWEVKAPHAERASAVERTQTEAEARAKEIVKKAGGGEVVIKGVDGKIRDSDTVPPGNDPNPPRDRKH